eukprot:1153816-Pelagomonas_calceolata.AAC.8
MCVFLLVGCHAEPLGVKVSEALCVFGQKERFKKKTTQAEGSLPVHQLFAHGHFAQVGYDAGQRASDRLTGSRTRASNSARGNAAEYGADQG